VAVASGLNVIELLEHDTLILTEAAAQKIAEVFAP